MRPQAIQMASNLLHERLRVPAWSQRNAGDNTTHVSYELPHRLHRAAQYPVISPNGSSIFIYAHQDGLTLVWRGGRRFRPDAGQNTQDDPMVLDPNYEEEDSRFENYQDDFDATSAVEPVVATVGISLGVPVFDLSFPPLPTELAGHIMRSVPIAFSRKVIITVICGDDTVRLITLPLAPPASTLDVDLSLETSTQGFRSYMVPELSVTRKNRLKGVAVTYAPSMPVGEGMPTDDQASATTDRDWDLVVAVHSSSPQPLLTVFHVPISASGSDTSTFELAKTESRAMYLPHPLSSIDFNPERFPSFRATRLLLADTSGAVRLAQIQRPSDDTFNSSLRWLGNLQTPFPRQSPSNSSSSHQRDRVLDARWALGGKAIAALLASGQWGIWDLEGAGPSRHDSIDGARLHTVHGGGVTNFTIRGVVDSSQEDSAVLSSRFKMRSHGPTSNQEPSQLAPMTPKTRRTKQDRLFSGEFSGGQKAMATKTPSVGGLSIIPIHASGDESRISDESIVIWYGSRVYVIPSLIQHWYREITSPSLDNGEGMSVLNSSGALPVRVPSTALGGPILGVLQVPNQPGPSNHAGHIAHDIVLALEHRVTIIFVERRQKKTAGELRDLFQQPGEAQQKNEFREQSNQQDLDMLHRGQLDLGGLDRMMDEMVEHGSPAELSQPRSRRVGFAS